MGLTAPRPAAPDDQLAYHRLAAEWGAGLLALFQALIAQGDDGCFHPHPLTPQAIQERIDHPGQDLYVVQTLRGKVVGYGMLRGWDEGYRIPSLGIAIHPDHRGQGLGRRLMHFLHDAAKNRGATTIRLTTHAENADAIRLYQQLGYQLSDDGSGRLVGLCSLEEAGR